MDVHTPMGKEDVETRRTAATLLTALSLTIITLTGASPAIAADTLTYPACTGASEDGSCEMLDDGQPLPGGYIAYSFPNDVSSFADVTVVAEYAIGRHGTYHVLREENGNERFLAIYAAPGTEDDSAFPSYPVCPDGAATSEIPPCQALYDGRPLPDGRVAFTFPYNATSLTALADVASHSHGRIGTYIEIGNGGPWDRYVAVYSPPPTGPCISGHVFSLKSGERVCVWTLSNGWRCAAYQVEDEGPAARSGRMSVVCYGRDVEIPDLTDISDPGTGLE